VVPPVLLYPQNRSIQILLYYYKYSNKINA